MRVIVSTDLTEPKISARWSEASTTRPGAIDAQPTLAEAAEMAAA